LSYCCEQLWKDSLTEFDIGGLVREDHTLFLKEEPVAVGQGHGNLGLLLDGLLRQRADVDSLRSLIPLAVFSGLYGVWMALVVRKRLPTFGETLGDIGYVG
jgi:hypothetical protein